jgi:hypothetical protein
MRARNFDEHFNRVSVFDIYTSKTYKDFVLLIATCPTASTMVRWAAKVITETILDFKPPPVNIDISVHDATSKDKKNTFTVVSTILPASPKALVNYLRGLNLTPPEDAKATLDSEGISVGPCAYRTTDGAKYVKVRIPGYSVPFVLDKSEVSWDRAATKQAILKNGIGGYILDQLYKVLETHSHHLMERARNKPLNLSMIDEYAKHRMAFYREPEPGLYEPALKRDIANPEYKPIIVFELGSLKNFVMIEDQIYRIRHFYSRKYFTEDGRHNQVVANAPVEAADGYFMFSDCFLIDPEDTFTIDKIGRCLKNKL